MLHHECVNELLAMFAGDGGVRLCRAWVGRILQESHHNNINEAYMIIMDHVNNGTHQVAAINEFIDVDAINNDDPPDVPIPDADNGATVNEGDVDVDAAGIADANDNTMSGEGEDQGRAKKSRTGSTPQKPSPPESGRAAVAGSGSFSTPTGGGGDDIIAGLMNSLGSTQLNDSIAGNDAPSEGATLHRDGEEEDSKMPPGADDDLKMPVVEAEEADDPEEEEPSSGPIPRDLPLGAILPPKVIETTAEDISMFHGRAQDASAKKYTNFVRMGWGTFVESVSFNAIRSDGRRTMAEVLQRGGEDWLRVKPERLTGFNYCKEEMLDFHGRVYFKSKNGLSYELDKNHWYVQTQLYISRCKCTIDGVEQRQIEMSEIADYIAKIRAGEEPGINTSVHYGVTKVVNEARSKGAIDRYQREKKNGLVPVVDVWNENENPDDDRFVDELHDLAEDAEKNFISFTTPMKIVQALGGDRGHLVDIDVPKYRGCIITDLQELTDEMEFESFADLTLNLRGFFKTASCNPTLFHRGLRSGDVFIFHHDKFFGGEAGRAAVGDLRKKRTVVYENGKKKK